MPKVTITADLYVGYQQWVAIQSGFQVADRIAGLLADGFPARFVVVSAALLPDPAVTLPDDMREVGTSVADRRSGDRSTRLGTHSRGNGG